MNDLVVVNPAIAFHQIVANFPVAVQEFAADHLVGEPPSWPNFSWTWIAKHQIPGAIAMLVAGPSTRDPHANHCIEFLGVGRMPPRTSSKI
jgi:hypothetical protein